MTSRSLLCNVLKAGRLRACVDDRAALFRGVFETTPIISRCLTTGSPALRPVKVVLLEGKQRIFGFWVKRSQLLQSLLGLSLQLKLLHHFFM